MREEAISPRERCKGKAFQFLILSLHARGGLSFSPRETRHSHTRKDALLLSKREEPKKSQSLHEIGKGKVFPFLFSPCMQEGVLSFSPREKRQSLQDTAAKARPFSTFSFLSQEGESKGKKGKARARASHLSWRGGSLYTGKGALPFFKKREEAISPRERERESGDCKAFFIFSHGEEKVAPSSLQKGRGKGNSFPSLSWRRGGSLKHKKRCFPSDVVFSHTRRDALLLSKREKRQHEDARSPSVERIR